MSSLIKIAGQFIRFAFISGVGLIGSFLILTAGLVLAHLGPFAANAIGDLCGAAFVFLTSAHHAFETKHGFLYAKLAFYIAWQALLITGISYTVATLSLVPLIMNGSAIVHILPPVFAKALIVPFTLLLNFLVAKLLLERVRW